MANKTRPNISDAWVQKLEKYKANRIAEWYTWYQLDEVMDQAYQYVLNNEKRDKEEQERDIADKEMTDRKLDSKDENLISEYNKTHRFYLFKKAVTQAYKAITWNYPKDTDDYTFAKEMTDANPESAATIHDYLSWNNVTLNDVMRDLNLENSTTKYKVPESDWSIYHEITSAGREWTEWNDRLADWLHQDTVSAYDADAAGNFKSQFMKNLWSSAWNVVWDTAGMAVNLYDSAKGLKDMVAWLWLYGSKALHDLVMWESTMEEFLAKTKPSWWYDLPNQWLNALVNPEEAVATVDAMKDYLVQRYGSADAIANTFYEDPVGIIRDVKDALRWFTWVAKKTGKVGQALDKINKLDNKYNPATKIENAVVKWIGNTVEWVSNTSLDDIKNIPSNVKWWIDKYAEKTKEAMWLLSEQERTQIQNNPYAWKQIQQAIEELNNKWDTVRPEQIYDSMVQKYVKEELVPELDKIINNVSEEWRVYWDVDKLRLKANNFQSEFEKWLKSQWVKIGSDWKLDFTKSHTINENSEAINKIYNQLKEMSNRWEDITVAEYRDMRKLIWSEMTKAGKWTTTYNLLKNLREWLNVDAHWQLSEFAQLDELFNKNAEKAKALKKWLVDKDWNIKPEAVARETKKTGKSTWLSSSEQLEELLPWHIQKMEWLNMALNMLKKYQQWEKATKALWMAGRWAWHAVWLITGWGIWGIAGWYIWERAWNKLGKYVLGKRDIDWNKALSEISEEWLNKLKAINDKIEKKWVITADDKAKIDEIIKSSQATKATQKAERKATQAATKAAEKAAIKAEKQKVKIEAANKKFKNDYNKYRWYDPFSNITSPAKSTSPFDNTQYDTWKSINQQFANRKK